MQGKPHIQPQRNEETDNWLDILDTYDLVEGHKNEQGKFMLVQLSKKGKLYLLENPKLKNPNFIDKNKNLIDFISNIIGWVK